VQEALTNCARHAGGKRVDVSVRLDGTMLELTVTDDGKGFPEERPRGMGLLGIEERVRELGGEVTIRRRTEGGTQLAVSIPLPAEERLA
jgi:signal transduction histidine kinase